MPDSRRPRPSPGPLKSTLSKALLGILVFSWILPRSTEVKATPCKGVSESGGRVAAWPADGYAERAPWRSPVGVPPSGPSWEPQGCTVQEQESFRSPPCHSPTPLGHSGFVAGGAGGSCCGKESAVLTSFPGDFDVGGLWAVL